MLRMFDLMLRAMEFAEAAYTHDAATRGFERLGMFHTDQPCRFCDVVKPLEAAERRARERFINLRGRRG